MNSKRSALTTILRPAVGPSATLVLLGHLVACGSPASEPSAFNIIAGDVPGPSASAAPVPSPQASPQDEPIVPPPDKDGSQAVSEVCDGRDNDGNGVIDDVDKGGDGICDCLRLGILGQSGRWGQGDVFASWLNQRSDAGATRLGDKVITKELLEGLHVVIAEDLTSVKRAYSPAEVSALETWVKAGGGLMTLSGFQDFPELGNVNALLAPHGMMYEPRSVLPRRGGPTVPVTTWAKHPVSVGVSRIGVDTGFPVSGKGTVIASEQGYSLLLGQEVGPGHVLVWADEWITYNSEWSGQVNYQVERFWINALQWLTPATTCRLPSTIR